MLKTLRIAVVLLLAGCGAREPKLPPVLIEANQVEPLLHRSVEYDRQRIAIDGYLHIDNGPTGEAIALMFQLTSRPSGLGEKLVSFDAERGTMPNQLDLPVLETQSFSDIPAAGEVMLIDVSKAKFIDLAGEPHDWSQKVRVIGRVAYRTPSVISADGSATTARNRPFLEDVTFEAAP